MSKLLLPDMLRILTSTGLGNMAKSIAKCILLLMVGMSIAVLWIYCHGFLAHDLAGYGLGPSFARVAAGMLTLLVLCAAPALPIYRLFPEHAPRAAALIGWVPLLLAALLAYDVTPVTKAPFGMTLALLEGGACWMAIVLGAWIVGRFTPLRRA